MYSVTKSLLSIAVGFAIQEGILSLDDKVSNHLPKESSILTDSNMRLLTLGRLTLNMGKWNGEQILDDGYATGVREQ